MQDCGIDCAMCRAVMPDCRLALYQLSFLSVFTGQADNEPLAAKVSAAMLTSAIGITVAQPSDVLKASVDCCAHVVLTFTMLSESVMSDDGKQLFCRCVSRHTTPSQATGHTAQPFTATGPSFGRRDSSLGCIVGEC
jgi:hypothetical protein